MKKIVKIAKSQFEIELDAISDQGVYMFVTETEIYKKQTIGNCHGFFCVNNPDASLYLSDDFKGTISKAFDKHSVYQFANFDEFLVWVETVESTKMWSENSKLGTLLKERKKK